MNAGEIETLIKGALPGAQVQVLGDDGRHFEAVVVSEAFAGRTRVQQHRMVYQALGGRMESYTPEAWRAKSKAS
jgi:acid stress-induced BolA-like protein IbaG/YrbA